MSDEKLSEGTPSPATPAPSLREATERLLAMEAEVEKFREAFAPPAAVSERWYVAKEAFEAAASPAAILALLAELESTRPALREATAAKTECSCASRAVRQNEAAVAPPSAPPETMDEEWEAAVARFMKPSAPPETTAPTATEPNTDAEFLMNMAGHFWRMDRECKSILGKGTSALQAARFERIAARLQPVASSATPTPEPTEDETLLNSRLTFTAHSGLPITMTGREWLRALTTEPR